MNETHRFMAWNVGFGARKEMFLPDEKRAHQIVEIVKKCDAKVIALDELAIRQYQNQASFSLPDYIRLNDESIGIIHFEPALSLGIRNSNPYGKLPELGRKFRIRYQEQGLGIWVRKPMMLRNLYSVDGQALPCVEVSRLFSHPLYMGIKPLDEKRYSAGRDEEDRPVLWARVTNGMKEEKMIYFASLHLPTLKNEENDPPETNLSDRQKEILKVTLGLEDSDVANLDELGTKLRVYCLKHLTSQVDRICKYWGGHDTCGFALAGDFNFEHQAPQREERQVLEAAGFEPSKVEGFSRPGERLVDNIWVKGAKEVNEVLIHERHIEDNFADILGQLSDHYPVVADIKW